MGQRSTAASKALAEARALAKDWLCSDLGARIAATSSSWAFWKAGDSGGGVGASRAALSRRFCLMRSASSSNSAGVWLGDRRAAS